MAHVLRSAARALQASAPARACTSRAMPGAPASSFCPPAFLRPAPWRMMTSASAETAQVEMEGVVLSDAAVERLKELRGEGGTTYLRVAVDAGGCSGFQYAFTFEEPSQVRADDKVFEKEGVAVVVDDISLGFVRGATVDYSEELIRASFQIIDNPNAESGCGCGASFVAK